MRVLTAVVAVAAGLLSGCATTRFIEPTELELGHAAGPHASDIGEDGYLQVQVSSNLGGNAERIKFYGSDAPKLIVVTAKLQPNAGPQRDQPAPEVPILSYDVGKATSEDLTARTLAGGIVVKAGSLSGAATLTLIVRGITESGAATLGPLMETIKKTPAAISGAATILGGVPITAFQTLVVPLLEKSAGNANQKWEKKKEYTFQIEDGLDSLDGRVVAFLLLTEDKREPLKAELCTIDYERPKLCLTRNNVTAPLTTPYLLFDLRVSDYRPIDDLVPQGGPCSTDRTVLAKTADAIAAGALTARQAFLEDLIVKRRLVLADIRDSGGSIDRLSRAAWRYERLPEPAPDSPRHAYWKKHLAARSQRVDECITETLAATALSTRRAWNTLIDGYRAIDDVEDALHRNADNPVPDAADAAKVEIALRKLNTAEAIPAIDAESRAYLVAGISNGSSLLERWYRAEVLRITGTTSSPDTAAAELKRMLARTRCTACVSVINGALTSLQSGASTRSTEAAVRRDGLVVDAVRTGARVDAARSVSDARAGGTEALRDAVDRSLEVKPSEASAAPTLDALHDRVDIQRDRADASLDRASPPASPPVEASP